MEARTHKNHAWNIYFRVSWMVRIGRIKAKVPRIGRIDARGVLAGRQAKAKTQEGRDN